MGRFDDLRENIAFRFDTPHRVLTATNRSEVAAALAEVDRATRAGSWAYGYVGYEAAAGLDENLLTAEPAPDGPPLLWFGLCAEPTRVPVVQPAEAELPAPNWRRDWGPAAYRDTVRRVREYVAAGETYQTNLTVRLRTELNPAELEQRYADLALGQRGAYSAYLDLGRLVAAQHRRRYHLGLRPSGRARRTAGQGRRADPPAARPVR